MVHADAAMSGLVSLLKVITPAEEGHSRPRAAGVMLACCLILILKLLVNLKTVIHSVLVDGEPHLLAQAVDD